MRSTETLPTAGGGAVTITVRSGVIGANSATWKCDCGATSEDGTGVRTSPVKSPLKGRTVVPVLTVTRMSTVEVKQSAGAHAANCGT